MAAGLEPGSRVGHLEIERELGRGSFAAVYLARDTRLERLVALKVLAEQSVAYADSNAVSSFLAEARVIARLQSPNLVTLFQLHERDGSLMLEMEYVAGGTLADLIRKGGVSAEQAETYLRGLLAGLGAAHAGGVLHRDIKPANILIGEDGVKISDFGLALVLGDEVDLDDGAIGTPLYMAPEALFGTPATCQTDIWSLGVVTYQMLAGRLPFPWGDAAAFFSAVQNSEPEPLPALVPAHLQSMIARCLEKDPDERAASCSELLEALDRPTLVAPIPTAPPEPVAGFHGRAKELGRFAAQLDTTKATLLVTGAAGVGKSALCARAATLARERGFLWIDALLSPVEGPMETLVQAVRVAALDEEDPLTSGFGPAGAFLKRVLRGEELPELQSRQQVLWTLEHLLSGFAARRPLALCVDDAHHASVEDVGLLADLARRLRQRPFLLVVAARPGSAPLAKLADTERIELAGLDREALSALLEERLGAVLPAEAMHRVVRRSDGNPLLAVELARHIEDTGAIVRNKARFELGTGWREDTVPTRLRDVVHARLASLNEDDRALLEVAAVDGREFDGRALAAVLGQPMLQVLRQLQRLSRNRALIAPSRSGYRFADASLQEVLYEDMGPELTRELHRALAEHLAARDETIPPQRLARHWERCGERARAAPYLLQMADQAKARQETHRIADLGERAGLLEDPPLVDPYEHVELAMSVAASLMNRARNAEAETLLDRMQATARERGETRRALQIDVHRAMLAMGTSGKLPDVDEEHIAGCAAQLGDTLYGGRAHALLGHFAKRRGDFEVATAAFREADRIFRAIGDDWQHSMAVDQLGSVRLRAGDWEEARTLYREAAELSERIGLTTNAAVSRVNGALASLVAGNLEGIEPELLSALRTFELDGAIPRAAQIRIYLAEIRFARGDPAGALEAIDAAVPDLERTGQRLALSNACRLRALLLLMFDRADEAVGVAQAAIEAGMQSGDRAQISAAHAAHALAAIMTGDTAAAHAAAEAAIECARSTQQKSGEVLLLLGEATLFGLPATLLESAGDVPADETDETVRAGVLAYARRDASGMTAAAQRLRELATGARGASYSLVAAWLDAEATGGIKAAAAIEAAAALGHVRAEAALRGRYG